MYIRITRKTDHDLVRTTYEFSISAPLGGTKMRIRFTQFYVDTRLSRRHRNWTTEQWWSHNDYSRSTRTVPKPDVPKDVIDEVIAVLMADFEFVL